MKKLILLIAVACLGGLTLNAQRVIDLESGLLPQNEDPALDYSIVGNPDGIGVAVTDNPNVVGNSSSYCLIATVTSAHPSYAGPKFDFSSAPFTVYGDPNNDNKAIVSIKMNKNIVDGIVRLRVIGDANTNYTSSEVPSAGEWSTLTFDISDRIGQTVTTFFIQSDFNGGRASDVIVYIDDVQIPDEDIPTSIEDELVVSPSIYAFDNIIKVQSELNIEEISLVDMTGRLVKQVKGQDLQEMNINALPKGVYIAKVKADGAVFTKKVMKN